MKNSNTEGLSASSMRAVNWVQLKTGMNSSAASTPCLRIKRNWRRRTRGLPTCAATFLTKRWTSLLKFLIRSEELRDFRLSRIRVLKDANRALMEYLSDVGEDPQIRQ